MSAIFSGPARGLSTRPRWQGSSERSFDGNATESGYLPNVKAGSSVAPFRGFCRWCCGRIPRACAAWLEECRPSRGSDTAEARVTGGHKDFRSCFRARRNTGSARCIFSGTLKGTVLARTNRSESVQRLPCAPGELAQAGPECYGPVSAGSRSGRKPYRIGPFPLGKSGPVTFLNGEGAVRRPHFGVHRDGTDWRRDTGSRVNKVRSGHVI
jgi:hypothetical protein